MTQPRDHRELVSEVPVWRARLGPGRDVVVVERAVQLMLNGRLLVRLNCLPADLEDLAMGFLASEGLLESASAVWELGISADGTAVEVRADVDPDRLVRFRERVSVTSGCGGGASAAGEPPPGVTALTRFRPEEITDRMRQFQGFSRLFRETGGVHASAATDGRFLCAFAEDVGRHNAIDKTIGRCLRQGIDLTTCAIVTTGRLTAEIVGKVARAGAPVLVSRGAATAQAIQAAGQAGLALVGFARGRRMSVYTAPWRLGLAEPPPSQGTAT